MADSDSSALRHPFRNDHYTSTVPTPPRIVVPPPALNSDALPDISIKAVQSSTYAFLHGVDYDNLVQSNPPLDWTYERRREAQPILPFLCLGPMTAAKDEKWLQEQGVTMLLGIRQKHSFESRLMQGSIKTAERLGIESQSVDLTGNQDLIRNFERMNHMINDHLSRTHQATNGQQLGKVLVFCESGNERSAGVVAAYLMEAHQDVDHIKAMQLCQAQRFCVNFDDGMKRLLEGYWDIILAKRAVQEHQAEGANTRANGHAVNGTNHVSAPRAKRALERDEDEDADMEGGDDIERFGGRTFVPFTDHGDQTL